MLLPTYHGCPDELFFVRDLSVLATGLGLMAALVTIKEAEGLPCWISRLGINFRPFAPPTIASLLLRSLVVATPFTLVNRP